ncbi:hypothetical protein BpHYR1_016256 [Brachionus plicatilis]|uniref:Uncharacterized protein n=1 Tax=Brachionus plicatilis TaxID=10195 RepID=A0A3M7RIX5_BRAPC|nr:hypothetical protein BpHYR1_016256 [Brachionus plicatilis]
MIILTIYILSFNLIKLIENNVVSRQSYGYFNKTYWGNNYTFSLEKFIKITKKILSKNRFLFIAN